MTPDDHLYVFDLDQVREILRRLDELRRSPRSARRVDILRRAADLRTFVALQAIDAWVPMRDLLDHGAKISKLQHEDLSLLF